MRKNCKCTTPCSCGDYVMPQAPNCSSNTCGDPEICSEITDAGCTVYTGDTILNIDIQNGQKVNDIIQRLASYASNPGCNYPDSPCKSTLVKSIKITSSTIKVQWTLEGPGTPMYQVQYRLPSEANWTVNTAVSSTTTTDTIGGLTPNTSYYVRVATLCDTTCYSVTLIITTKTS